MFFLTSAFNRPNRRPCKVNIYIYMYIYICLSIYTRKSLMYINRPRHLCIRTAHDMQRQAIKKAIMSSTRHQICIKSYVAVVWHDIIRENQTAKPDDSWSLQVWEKNMHHWTRHDGQRNIRIRVWCECFSCRGFSFYVIFYACYFDRVWFELYPGTGSVEKTVTNGLGRVNFRRTTNAIVWGWDFNQCPVGSVERNKEKLPGNNDCTRVDFQWG